MVEAKTLILAGGFFNLAFAVFHLFFWRIFGWKQELAKLSFINRAIVQVLNLCLIFAFFIFAYVSFANALCLRCGDRRLTAEGRQEQQGKDHGFRWFSASTVSVCAQCDNWYISPKRIFLR